MNSNFSCGKRIRELRQQRGLSQEQLALNAEITPAYLGQVERGIRNATVAIIEKICTALTISLADFFSVADVCLTPDNDIVLQIAHQLTGLSNDEKQAVLQLVKNAVILHRLGIENSNKGTK